MVLRQLLVRFRRNCGGLCVASLADLISDSLALGVRSNNLNYAGMISVARTMIDPEHQWLTRTPILARRGYHGPDLGQ